MSLPSINFLHLPTVSEIQAGQTFPATHPDTMGENNTPIALKACAIKTPDHRMPWNVCAVTKHDIHTVLISFHVQAVSYCIIRSAISENYALIFKWKRNKIFCEEKQ